MKTSSFGVKVVGYMGDAGYMGDEYQARAKLGTVRIAIHMPVMPTQPVLSKHLPIAPCGNIYDTYI